MNEVTVMNNGTVSAPHAPQAAEAPQHIINVVPVDQCTALVQSVSGSVKAHFDAQLKAELAKISGAIKLQALVGEANVNALNSAFESKTMKEAYKSSFAAAEQALKDLNAGKKIAGEVQGHLHVSHKTALWAGAAATVAVGTAVVVTARVAHSRGHRKGLEEGLTAQIKNIYSAGAPANMNGLDHGTGFGQTG